MLFNSYEYIFLLLPITFFIYFYLNHKKLTELSKVFLVASSLFFYSYWNIVYLPLILLSIVTNYLISKYIAKKEYRFLSKKIMLQIGLIFNIGLLAYFKYMDFFIENFNSIFNSNIALLHLALPLAISFYTLQQIAFLVDAYRGRDKEYRFIDYALFVTFFPQLIAGPIVRHDEMMPQFINVRNKVRNYKNITMGLFIFSVGLFKKVVIADTFSIWATQGFDVAQALNFFEAWATSLSYTFQLYFDFSGYTDMAIGAGLLFNIKLPQNFNSPYKATNMIDYWNRWHMTLTRFITAYIYLPITKTFKRLTFNKAILAIVITFLVAGLWHGASWMFVIFGFLNGIGVAINHYWQKKWKRKLGININKYIAWFITFNYVNIFLIFFRAKEWSDAVKVLKGMIDVNSIDNVSIFFKEQIVLYKDLCFDISHFIVNLDNYNFQPLTLAICLFLILYFNNSNEKVKKFKPTFGNSFVTALFFVISFMFLDKKSEFLYFNF